MMKMGAALLFMIVAPAVALSAVKPVLAKPTKPSPRPGPGQSAYIKDPHRTEPVKIKMHTPPTKPKSGKRKGFAGAGAKKTGASKKSADDDVTSDGWRALRTWIEARGGKADGLDIREVAPGLRGVVATRDFAAGELIFSLPRDACILDEGMAAASPVADLWNDASAEFGVAVVRRASGAGAVQVSTYARVALLLLWLERTPETKKVWAPALAMLPSRSDFEAGGGPMRLWSEAEVSDSCADARFSLRADPSRRLSARLRGTLDSPRAFSCRFSACSRRPRSKRRSAAGSHACSARSGASSTRRVTVFRADSDGTPW